MRSIFGNPPVLRGELPGSAIDSDWTEPRVRCLLFLLPLRLLQCIWIGESLGARAPFRPPRNVFDPQKRAGV